MSESDSKYVLEILKKHKKNNSKPPPPVIECDLGRPAHVGWSEKRSLALKSVSHVAQW